MGSKTYLKRLNWIGVLAILLLAACETEIFPELEDAPPVVVVDAWIDDTQATQVVKLTYSQNYFEATEPQGVQGATVFIMDDSGNRYDFIESGTNGSYEWNPTPTEPGFDVIGRVYELQIETDGIFYFATTMLTPSPDVDSVRFRLEDGNSFIDDSFFGEVFARDFDGPGNSYWIKSWKNGEFLNKPDEINIPFDAGFSPGGNIDGVIFIPPIRDGVNPFETDEDDQFISPYAPGDSLYVEIHSISNEAWNYLNEVRIQTDRQGGFSELFAVPLSNVPTNINSSDPDNAAVLGFFNVASVTTGGARLDPNNLPE